MDIVVLVKAVPDAQAPRRLVGPDLLTDRTGPDDRLSELDEYALEAALQLVESAGGTVTAVTMGPEGAAVALRAALQLGADRGVQVLDGALAGSDALATSLVLAAAVRRLAPDAVVTGMASTDGGMGAVPAMVAERLDWPQLTVADRLEVSGGTARIERERLRDTEIVEAALPAVIGVTDRANEPRYPSFRSIMAAKKKPVETLSLSDLGIAPSEVGLAAAATRVVAAAPRPARQAGTVVVDGGDAGIRLADFLAESRLL